MTTITREQLIEDLKSSMQNASGMFEISEDTICALMSLLTAPPAPTVTFYRDGIESAAAWVDKQREEYDNEHGRHDPDTGAFEFGNDAQRDYSATLEEIAEGIRALHPNTAPPAPDDLAKAFISAIEKEQDRLFGEDYLMDSKDCIDVIREEAQRLNSCRASMLQGKADTELQRKASIHDALCEKYNVESLAHFVDWQRNHIAELEAEPPARVGEGESAVMPDYPGYTMTQRECFDAGTKRAVPDGWVAVPIVPTEDMVINGFESEPDPHFSDEKEWAEYEALSGCRQAARRAELCWAAMIRAAPKLETN